MSELKKKRERVLIKKNEIGNGRLLVGADGCQVNCICPDGEVVWSVGYKGGIHFVQPLKDFMSHSHRLEIEGNGTFYNKAGRMVCQALGQRAFETGANPDFKPSVASEAEKRLRKQLEQVNKASSSLDGKMKAFQRMLQEQGQVIEEEEPDGQTQTPEKGTETEETGSEIETPVPLQEVKKEGAE
ncbi:hypothetical protein [Tritonibacter mobilis]|uniref:hypothetical protein n=1 Tax=Tritonibacter mobilis TaxID=379347 RepID=UPI001C087D89|nr:hypothetical protein [Tritonibacter mobilis]MBU3036595.1 hypothetical protein [Tritonibacter mobilis]WHQ84443.1 hypothetical protein OMR53_20040 [Tritonibacter mobilis]